MPPLSPAEHLFYSTVKITSLKNGNPHSVGTGFLFTFRMKDGFPYHTLVTNKHVISGSSDIRISLQIERDGRPSGFFVNAEITIPPGEFFNHPDDKVDLCAIPIFGLISKLKEEKVTLFLKTITKDNIPTKEEFENLDAIEDVIMVGYPSGLSDEKNGLPLVRKGITSTPINNKYNGLNEFVVDMACFHGSSGSPVFIHDKIGHWNRSKNIFEMGNIRLYFVGILHSGPTVKNTGTITLNSVPRVEVTAMIHLGNVIRADRLLDIEQLIIERLGST